MLNSQMVEATCRGMVWDSAINYLVTLATFEFLKIRLKIRSEGVPKIPLH